MKRSLISFAMYALLAGLLTMSNSRITLAQEPEAPRVIPRHRVGHRAKVANLDEMLAQGLAADPLAGNYTLVDWDEIVLTWEGGGEKFNLKLYDVNETLGSPSPKAKLVCPDDCWGSARGLYDRKHLDVVAGNFCGPGKEQIVAAWEKADREIILEGLNFCVIDTLDQFSSISWSESGEHVGGNSEIRLAAGDFDGDGADSVLLAWHDTNNAVSLKAYDNLGSGFGPKLADEQMYEYLDVATGDFDGDGDDEVVVVWGDWWDKLHVKVYDVDQNLRLYAKARFTEAHELGGPLAVATGDFNGDAIDEIVVGWHGYDDQKHISPAMLRIYQVVGNLGTLVAKGLDEESDRVVTGGGEVDVATGDFNADGVDEIVFAFDTDYGDDLGVAVRIFAATGDLNLRYKSEILDEREGGEGHLSVATGDLDRNARDEIVLAWEGNDNRVGVKIYQVDATDLSRISARGKRTDEAVHGNKRLAVAVGNFDGDSIRVGFPRHWPVPDVEQVLAVIKAPPQHYDVIDGTTHAVNYFENTRLESYASYETETEQRTEMSLTTTRDWSASVGLEGMLGDEKLSYVKASMTATFGEGFEKTATSFEAMKFGTERRVTTDDAIILIETDYDVWEYPVYTESSDRVNGHFLVVFPRSPGKKHTLYGKDPLAFYFYRPPGENLNLLSYSQWVPADYDARNLIKGGDRYSLGTGSDDFWLSGTEGSMDQSKKSSNLGLSIGVEAQSGGPGGHLKVSASGQYHKESVSTHKVSVQETTKIHVHLGPLQDEVYSYWIEPYVYWSPDDGHLVVDYAAGPKSTQDGAPLHTWWDDTYSQPDPTFNLPWKYRKSGDPYRLLTKGIAFEPAAPIAGETVTITAKVSNYSLMGADNVAVRFYLGDPDAGGVPIGDDHAIQRLGSVLAPATEPGPSATVTQTFDTSGYGNQTLDIYAVVDPDSAIDEVHEENNKAYTVLPVAAAVAPAMEPPNLYLTPESITFDPETPALGESVRLSAEVRSEAGAFFYVPVLFYDGDPRHGGRLIGGEVIPLIPAGERATASVMWDTTGQYGPREIWVGVDYTVGEEAPSTDNWASRTISLPPFRLYMPLLWRGAK